MLDRDAEDLSRKNICFRCVHDIYLCDKIRKRREIHKCSYCGYTRSCYSIGEMSDIIEEAFEQHYVRTSDKPSSLEYLLLADKESNYYWERTGVLSRERRFSPSGISPRNAPHILAVDRH
jgi:hypothetical protein